MEAFWLATVFTLLLLVSSADFAHAQETRAQGTITAPEILKGVKAKKVPLSLRMTFEAASSFHDPNAYERKSETSLEIAPSIGLTSMLKLALVSSLSREFDAAATTTLSNTRLSLSHAVLPIGREVMLTPSVSATLPTNKFAVDDDTYQGALGGQVSLSRDLQDHRMPITVAARFGYERSFHQLTLNSGSAPNIRERIREGLNLKWMMNSRWSLSVDAMATQAWTYRGVIRNRFDLSQELGFDVDPKLGFYIGHSNGGNAFKANGRDSNIALFDANSSMFRAGANYLF